MFPPFQVPDTALLARLLEPVEALASTGPLSPAAQLSAYAENIQPVVDQIVSSLPPGRLLSVQASLSPAMMVADAVVSEAISALKKYSCAVFYFSNELITDNH